MFWSQLIIGVVLICITVIIHAVVLDRLIVFIDKYSNSARLRFGRGWKAPMLILAVLGTFAAHIVQIWVWAVFYMQIGEFSDMESSLYFSTSTFTTVGFGDIVLDKSWRLVSSFQSANGFILFGWSTAFIFEVMNKLYKREETGRN